MIGGKLLSASAAVQPTYIEDVFSTYLYTGTGAAQAINNGLKVSGANVGALTYSNTLDGTEIDVDSQGNYYRASSGSVIKNSPTGAFLWGKTLDSSNRFFTNVAVDSEDNVIVCQTALSLTQLDVYKFNGSTGAVIWKKNYNSVNGRSAIKCFGTRIFIVGHSTSFTSFVMELSASTGSIVSSRTQSVTYGSYNHDLAIDPVNSILYVCGYNGGSTGSGKSHIFKYSISGALTRTAAISLIYSNDTTWESIDVDSSGNVYVAGSAPSVQGNMVAKFNSSLVEQWKVFFTSDSNNARRASIKISETGNVLARLGVFNSGVHVVSLNSSTGAVIKNSGFSGDPGTYNGDRNMIYRGGNFLIPMSNNQVYVIPNASATTDLSPTQVSNVTTSYTGTANTIPSDNAGTVTLLGDISFTPADAASSAITFLTSTPYEGKGGLTWIKTRSLSYNHFLFDTNRGALNELNSNTADAQASLANSLTGFNSNGFSLGSSTDVNGTSATFASWSFCQAPRFFDVVTYTGTGANRTISHDLGIVPGCIIVKRTDTTGDWQVYHRSLANTEYLVLNSTAAKATGATRWNSTTPTSSVFSLGTDATVNASGGTYVAYLFAHDPLGPSGDGSDGLIACGSFSTTGSDVTVNLGWEPQWLLVKRASGTSNWAVYDAMRGLSQTSTAELIANGSIAETVSTSIYRPILTPTGFIAKNSIGYGSGETITYIAIRRGPMREPTVGAEVFSSLTHTGTGAARSLSNLGFSPDLLFSRPRSGVAIGYGAYDRLRGFLGSNQIIQTYNTGAEFSDATGTNASITKIEQGVISLGSDSFYGHTNLNTRPYVTHAFRRAPGFFDVVAYGGTGSTGTKNHNLGVVPEMMIFKNRNDTDPWFVYHQATGNTGYTPLNSNSGFLPASLAFNNTSPTATVFTVGSTLNFSSSFNYIAYLFASLPGISKVGSYTGNGSNQTINCGFTTGARFILIKRTDSTGDWYVWDTARGIVSGNDPYLSPNTTAAEVTTDDTIDPDNSGFIVNQVAATNVNVNAATYIYLAIA